jgi:hypothetical protein
MAESIESWLQSCARTVVSQPARERAVTKSGIAPVNDRYFTVPRKTKSRHTANEVHKQAGLPKAF